MTTNPSSTAAAGRSGHRGVLFAMCLSLVLVVASVTALNLALPDLAVDLNASNSSLTWIADGYTVSLAALVLPLGALGDRIGRRKVLVAGNLVFGGAAALAALSSSTSELIAWRVVMGVGAAMIMPGTLATITAAFPPHKKAQGVATWSGFAAAGGIIGMLAAGGLLEAWSWKSIFATSAAVAVLCALVAVLLSPETKSSTAEPFDWEGTVSTALAVGTLVYGIIEGNEQGWTRPEVLAAFAVTALSLLAYVVLGLRSKHPMLDPRLFRLRGFSTGALTILTQFMAVFGFFFVGLQFLQLILGYGPLKSAVALIPVAVAVLPTTQITPRLVSRIGLKAVMASGLLLLALGMLWLSRLDIDSGYLAFVGGLGLAGVGMGLTGSSGTSAIVGSLGPDRQGVASAMNDTTREVGSAIGIALMGSVFAGQYRSTLPESIGQLPADAAETVRHSAAGGLEVAAHMGAGGIQLADAVRDAFMSGFSDAMATVAALLVVAAAACLVLAPRHAEGPPAEAPDGLVELVEDKAPEELPATTAAAGLTEEQPAGRSRS
ncbi:MFS transporter [Streptomyces sp. NPDC005808]|uniref:MFS transporter n=1 Tax=Streptomyces sp. NPDC005808 TaxID=3364734 RepID=UPI00369CDAE2